jgi:hypothetical protein
MVKLTDYGIANPLERWTKQGSIGGETLKDGEDKSGALQATSTTCIYQIFIDFQVCSIALRKCSKLAIKIGDVELKKIG